MGMTDAQRRALAKMMGMTDDDRRAWTKMIRHLTAVIELAGRLAWRMARVESLLSAPREPGARLSEWRRIHNQIDAIAKALDEEACKIADGMLAEQEKGKMN